MYLENIQNILTNRKHFSDDVVIENKELGYYLSKASLERFSPGKWFNDEIMNGYIKLVNHRDQTLKISNMFCFNTFFYTLIENQILNKDYNYQKLERCLKRQKVSLKDYKLILVPINIEKCHWVLLTVDLPNK